MLVVMAGSVIDKEILCKVVVVREINYWVGTYLFLC